MLPRHEDVLARERYLLYAAISRPEEVLFLSFRSSDEEGDPALPSAFVDSVRALFAGELWERRGRRLLADVTWPPGSAPTPHELRRARAAAEEPGPAAARRTHDRAGARCPRRPRDRGRARAGDLRRLRRPLARRQRAAARARRPGSGADAPRLDRPCRARADAPAPAGARRLRPPHAGLAPRRARGARRRDGGAAPKLPARAPARSCASSRSTCGGCSP